MKNRLNNIGMFSKGAVESGCEIVLAREEQQIQEKLAALTVQSRQLSEKETKLEEFSLQLEQDKAKVKAHFIIIIKHYWHPHIYTFETMQLRLTSLFILICLPQQQFYFLMMVWISVISYVLFINTGFFIRSFIAPNAFFQWLLYILKCHRNILFGH